MFYTLIGSMIGFAYFVSNLESNDMGNVLFRNDCDNNIVFRFDNLLYYMDNAMSNWFLWHPKLWNCNWIITTTTGMLIGGIIDGVLRLL